MAHAVSDALKRAIFANICKCRGECGMKHHPRFGCTWGRHGHTVALVLFGGKQYCKHCETRVRRKR